MFAAYRSLQELPAGFGPTALAIGNFDGVHVGHARIFQEVVRIARAGQWQAMTLTFDPHPTRIVAPDRIPRLLTSVPARLDLFRGLGLDAVLVLPFTAEVARLDAEEFVGAILVSKLAARAVVVGPYFRFGRGQAGHVATLESLGRRFGFQVHLVEPVRCRGELVSSSGVRRLIERGSVSRAMRMLGRPFSVEGRIVRGHGVGAKQAVPTLNLAHETEVLPARGVYMTCTFDPDSGRRWPSVTNIGVRPTFDGADLSIETFLLRPLEGDTPSRISLAFWRRIRDEIKFPSAEQLRAQILRDAAAAEKFFRRLQAARPKEILT
jgi:riboflavin kinase/FMN adenylyltransferase